MSLDLALDLRRFVARRAVRCTIGSMSAKVAARVALLLALAAAHPRAHVFAAAAAARATATPTALPPPAGATEVPPELRDLDAFLARVSPIPDLAARLEAVSRPFLGLPYALDPLGEGPGAPDADPLWDFTRCDCQTLVEQVIALAFSRDARDFEARMRDIRYVGGVVSYETRKHLVEPRWLPTLVAAGYLAEATAAIGGAATRRATLVVGEHPLAARFEKLRKKAGRGWPEGTFELDYLPLDAAIARWRDLPPGTLLLPVKAAAADVPFLVSHMGLVLERDGKRIFRHASSSPILSKVLDQAVAGYLKFLERYFAAKERPVIGVALYRVTDPAIAAPP